MDLRQPDRAAMPDAAVDALDDLLEQRAVPFKGMSLEMLDGYLCALAVGPEPVAPAEWMAQVWGARPPRWETPAEADHVEGLLLALWADVSRRVAIDPARLRDRDTPLIAFPGGDDDDAATADDCGIEWAGGFLDGVELRRDAWDAWSAAQPWIDEALAELEAVATGTWPEGTDGTPAEPLVTEDRLELVAGIPSLLADLNMHRLEAQRVRTPIRQAPPTGRNDPCPCGSGKKFKKCCAANTT